MIDFLKDLWDFMRVRKKFWLAPIIIVLLLLNGPRRAGPSRAGRNNAKLGRAGPGRAVPDRAKPGRPGPSSTGPSRDDPDRTMPSKACIRRAAPAGRGRAEPNRAG